MRSKLVLDVMVPLIPISLLVGCAGSQVPTTPLPAEAWLVEVKVDTGDAAGAPPMRFTVEGDRGTRQCGGVSPMLRICRVGGDFETPIFDIQLAPADSGRRLLLGMAVQLGWHSVTVVEFPQPGPVLSVEILDGRRSLWLPANEHL